MGADGSRLSFQQKQEQTELLMQQNVEIAEHLSQQHAAHKKKHDTVLDEVGKNMFAHVKLINNGADAPNQMEKIEIEGVTYEIFDFISKGGFGQVYKARARNNNRIVAIKIMKNTPDIREEIQNEIRFLSLTKTILLDNHPVINYYGSQFTKENIHIAMELAVCDLVAFWLTQVAQTEPENKFLLGITMIVYVLRALTFLEKLNIIHGDIKPQNFVIVPDNKRFYVKLIDFGTVEKMDTSRAQITVDATKAHTIYFASPEFLRRDKNNVMARHLHKKSDAWAAGVMFYILFFDRLPWKDQFDYENFCNDPDARDIFVPRKGGYKLIIELLLKKDPVERSSAKATLMQMKGHPALHYIIESLHESFCPVDDVCRMTVPGDVHQQLAKLAKPGHFVRASASSLARSLSEPRCPCRYGRNCYNHDADHRKNFAHPGDSDYHVPGGASSHPLKKPECRYGADCFRVDADHLNKYAHPIGSSHHSMSGNSQGHPPKPKCRYGAACYDKDPEHRRQYAHPFGSSHHSMSGNSQGHFPKPNCRHGAACYDKDPEHRSQYAHPNGSASVHCAKMKCSYGANCTKMKDPEHTAKFQHW